MRRKILVFTQNILLKNIVVHILTTDEKPEHLRIIVESYYLFVEDKDKFYNWFMMENKENLTGFDIAAQRSNKDVIKFLFEIISKTDEGKLRLTEKRNSIFHYAAKKNQCYPIVFFYEKLQKYFPNNKIFDMPNQFDITPLHYACFSKSFNVVDLLLDLGADFNARDVDGKSVLSYAVCSGSTRAVKKLLIRGADKSIEENNGKKPIDLAEEKGYDNMVELLRKKNCVEKCCSVEIGSIKGIRYDYELLNFFLIYFLILVGTILRYFQKNKVELTTETVVLVFLLLSIIAVFFSMIMASYFICCFKRRRRSNKIKKTLTELFEESQNICVKCRKPMKYDTIHCLVCDICVENWDHHCFWLNTCIDKKVKFKFLLFFGFLFVSLLLNAALGISLLIDSILGENSKTFLTKLGISEENSRIILYIISSIYIFCFFYPFVFNLLPIFKEMRKIRKGEISEDTTLSEIETKLLSGSLPPKEDSSFN